MGRADLEDLKRNTMMFAQIDSAPHEVFKNPDAFLQFLFQELRQRIFALWLIRDCAVDAKQFFLELNGGGSLMPVLK